MESIISKLQKNNWEIQSLELNETVKSFLALYGKEDPEYNGLANDEESLTWSSPDGKVTINGYTNLQASWRRAKDGESRGNCEIIENDKVVFGFSEYLNPEAATGNANYNQEIVRVNKDDLWLRAVYTQLKQGLNNELHNEQDLSVG